ncbi:4-diphosphocytidyl-2-C-methyl-D-erythritol kinase [Actinomycetota bacterium]|nr:4-diphosphocytidyl-2-C-methyl-D-erythritol kinase [Actinomycetota bacterium]
MTLYTKGYAKVNLGLWILGSTGSKHRLKTLYYALPDLYDDVSVVPGTGLITTNSIDIPLDDTNIAAKALDFAGLDSSEYDIEIIKRIPIAAGLAGGSADAAAALVSSGVQIKDYRELEVVGADVPFALEATQNDGTIMAIGSGFGEVLEEVVDIPKFKIDVFPQDLKISASESYKRFDELIAQGKLTIHDEYTVDQTIQQILDSLRSKDIETLSNLLHNDLENVALDLYPQLYEPLFELQEQFPDGVVFISGSGPTICALSF